MGLANFAVGSRARQGVGAPDKFALSGDEPGVDASSALFPPITVAFADPPYEGEAQQHYGSHPDFAGEVNYELLVRRLNDEYADGWALCMKVASLPMVLGLLASVGKKSRVGAWVKRHPIFKRNVNPAYAWDPVVFVGGRRRPANREFINDWCISDRGKKVNGFVGAKPDEFSLWVFNMLGLSRGDTLVDLFPGTGSVSIAWKQWCSQRRLF